MTTTVRRGGNLGKLTPEHQRKSALMPRPRLPSAAKAAAAASGESLDDAVLRYQRAKADTEERDAEKRSIDIAKSKGELIPADDAQDELEATHLCWVAEIEQLPHAVASALPPEVPASVREQVRAAVEAACMAARTRIGT